MNRLRALLATRSFRLVLACACAGVVVAFYLIPPSSRLSHLDMLVAGGAALAGLVSVLPRPRRMTAVAVAVALGLVVACAVDRGPLDDALLTRLYVDALRRSASIPYVWGGEGDLGVDCSGLLRRARIRACAAYALATGRPRALAMAADLWWHDASAEEMAAGYGGRTIRIKRIPSLNGFAEAIEPGDIFVTANGVHVMAGLGRGEIAQSDPHRGRVCIDRLPEQDAWYRNPVERVVWAPTQLSASQPPE